MSLGLGNVLPLLKKNIFFKFAFAFTIGNLRTNIYICSFNQPPYVVLTNPPLPENDEKMIIIIITIILPFSKASFF